MGWQRVLEVARDRARSLAAIRGRAWKFTPAARPGSALFGAGGWALTAARRRWRLVVTIACGISTAVGITIVALPQTPGPPPAGVVLAPGSQGSSSSLPWWDPRGWFSAGTQAPASTAVPGTDLAIPTRPKAVRQAPAPRAHRVRELTSKRSEFSRTFQLSNGQRQAVISAGPVNYRDHAGRWQPVNTAVTRSVRAGWSLQNTTNVFGSFFGTDPARLVRFSLPAGGWLQTGLPGGRRVTPRVSGNTVTYPQILPGVTLEYSVSPSGLKERIVLASASADVAGLRFTVTAGGGLVPRAMSGGGTGWYAGSQLMLVSPAPFMTDARADKSSPLGHPWSTVGQRTSWDAARSTETVSVVPSQAWLGAAGRVWPVTVDPTITIAPVPCQKYNPDDPTGCAHNVMISSDSPSTNFNSSMSWPLPVGTTATGIDRGLIQFPLGAIPAGSQIDSADLNLYWDDSFYPGTALTQPAQTVQAYQAKTAWDPTTVTWNSNIQLGTEGMNRVTVTSTDAGTTAKGAWPSQASTSAANGSSYRYDQDTTAGDTFTFVPQLTEAGTYQVQDHYVASTTAASNAPVTVHYQGGSASFTVNQQSGTGGVWSTMGNESFVAGTAGSAVVGDGPATATVRVEADGVRFTKYAQVTDASAPPGQGLEGDRWDSFAVRNIVQNWVSGQANDGFVLKAANEGTLGIGGPEYERSGFYYNGETAVYPQLVVTYGQLTSVSFKPITVIRDNGANLSWTAYQDPTPGTNPGDDLAEYQVHRSVFQSFTPSGSTLVAPVAVGTTSFNDTTAVPAPPGATLGNAFYYMIAVKTQDGTIVPGPVQLVRLPLGGQTTVIIPSNGAATLSSAQPSTNLQSLFGFPWLMTGNNGGTCSSCFGTARSVFTFPSVSSLIPSGVHLLDSELKLWGMTNNPGGAPTQANYQAHNITQAFTPSQVTWNSAATGTAWTTAGGTFGGALDTGVTGLTNDPNREEFTVTSAVQSWLTTPSSQHGLMIKVQNEASTAPQDQELWLSPGAAEPALAPTLVVTYTDPSQTYYAPATPRVSAAKSTYSTQVTVTNPTASAWGTNWQLGYHWVANDGTTLVSTPTTPVYTALPATLNPGSQATITETVATPDTVTGVAGTRSGYQLVWDMYNSTANTWLSSGTSTPNVTGTGGTGTEPPAGQVTSVAETAETLGLEKYFQYTGMATGSGSMLENNDANGNVVWNYSPFSNPSNGFRTFVRLDYNSMDTTESSMGFGWSLQTSTLTRLGTPLDFHPPGNPNSVTLTDANGGSHVFTLNTTVTPNVWTSPPGFHYYLQQLASCDPTGQAKNNPVQAWQITAPDNTRFLFDCSGYQTAVIDKNGNEADFVYSQRKSANQPTEFLDYITDPAHRQTLTINYYTKGQNYSYIDDSAFPPTVATGTNLTNPDIVDQIASITDISGRKISFLYDTKGLMSQMTDGPNTVAADGPVWSGPASTAKVFSFGYDPTQGNKNVKMVSVTDPRNDTTCLYYYPPSASFKWSLQAMTSRRADPASSGAMAACPATPASAYETQFAYTALAAGANPLLPNGGVQTDVTDPLGHKTSYLTDTSQRPVQVTDPVGRNTTLTWDSDNNLSTRTENNGAVTTWTWDPNTGYPLTMQDAANRAAGKQYSYSYQTSLIGHVAFLTSVTSPLGNITSYGHDTFGNVTSVTAPDGNVSGAAAGSFTSNYTYNSDGTLATAKDPDGNVTKYLAYDPTGLPTKVTDPRGNTVSFAYSPIGEVTSDSDAYGHTITTTQYDVFGRPGLVTTRKSATQNITIAAPVYDGNGNVTTSHAPSYSATTPGATTSIVYNPDDEVTSATTPPDSGSGTGPTTTRSYYNDDTLASVIRPDAATPAAGATTAQYTTTYAYFPDQQVQTVTDGLGHQTGYTYDNVGNVHQVTDPNNNTVTYAYDLDHRAQQVTDANGNFSQTTRDADGRVIQARDKNGNVTLSNYDASGQLIQQQVPVQAPGQPVSYATTQFAYDQAGNRTQVLTPLAVQNGYSLFSSPPSTCTTTPTTSPCPFTWVTTYNPDNQVATQQSPAGGDGPYSAPQVTTYSYDNDGRPSQVTAPPSNGDLPSTGLNTTGYTYWDNGWAATSTDPRGVVTSWDYAPDGQQSSRVLTSADGGMSRGMGWSYYPDGKLQQVTDNGVPTGSYTEMVDSGDAAATATGGTNWATGTCPAAPTQPLPQAGTPPLQPACGGPTYRTHPIAAAGSTTDAFTWHLDVPADGKYTIYVKYPALPSGTTAATGANYTITTNGDSSGGGTPVTVTGINQTQNAGTSSGGTWVKLGEWQFNRAGTAQQVTLNPAGSTGATGSVVVASAVEAVSDTTGITNTAVHGSSYTYDLDGNTTGITGTSGTGTSNTAVTVAITPDVLDRTSKITESWANGGPSNTTSYTYDAASNIATLTHTITQGTTTTTDQNATYTWNNLNQLKNETDGPVTGDSTQKTTAFTYTPAGQIQTQQQPNGNLISDQYTAAGQVYTQAECTNKTSPVIPAFPITSPTAITCGTGGQLVTADAYTYDVNSQQTQDLSSLMSADSSSTHLSHTWNYSYNPVGQLTQVSDGSAQTEAYQHDPQGDIISQVIGNTSAPATTSTYSRGLLQSTTTSGQTSTYNYDPLGRLDTVTGPDGSIQEANTYDGFDNLISNTTGSGASATTTSFKYDPLNRLTSQTTGSNTSSY
ncbi:MAG TPA: DNRLRE domain-containing protein, partial [Streptosporangiaceae bacterium]